MAIGDEVVLESDPKEEEEEEELVDPQETLKESCSGSAECEKYKTLFDACAERVSGNSKSDETCEEELFDFVHCVDHCVGKSLFTKLK
ncbi:hypothetical protein ACOMHN_024638 [Nucella lapillus]